MNDNYLWEQSGEPDPDVQYLERLLRPLGVNQTQAAASIRLEQIRGVNQRRVHFRYLALAACILVALLLPVLWLHAGPTSGLTLALSATAPLTSNEAPRQVDAARHDVHAPVSVQPDRVLVQVTVPQRRLTLRNRAALESMAAEQREEEFAAEILFRALNVSGGKLNLARRRALAQRNATPES